MAHTSNSITRKIGCPHLSLHRGTGHGYWYFTYDNEAAGIFETASVYTPRLNDLPEAAWVEEGKALVASVEGARA